MRRSRQRWNRRALWAIPLAYAAAALVVGLVLPRVEHRFLPGLLSPISAASAMSICSAIASGMIALTGIVFSLAFVMVQFSATAYSPRLVLWISRNPVLSHAMGIFIATFLYALMVLAWVDRETLGRVPLLSAGLVFVLLLASMGMFIALIQSLAILQIGRMLIFTGEQGRRAIEALYAAPASTAAANSDRHRDAPVTRTLCHAGRPQAVQAVDLEGLVELAAAADAVIELAVGVGGTVVESAPMLRVRGGRQPIAEAALRNAIEFGDERTFEQDPKYAIRILVDIAIRALSPAINDPTTASQALNHIEDLLLRLGRSRLEIGEFHDREGRLRLVVPFPTWEDFLLLALEEIRACGAGSVQVMRRMNALVRNLTELLPAERHPALRHWEERLQGSIVRSFADVEERGNASVADGEGLGIRPEDKP